jgi:zinc/manganese transport system substrate-binding protein
MHIKTLLQTGILFSALAITSAQAAVFVFTCEPEWAALAEEIAGAQVKTYSATNALQDPHYIQARPSLIAKIRKADLLICSGSDLEIGWLPLLLRKGNNPKIQPGKPGYLMASQYVKRLEIPMVVDRAQGDIHPQGNPHIQTNPHNLAIVAKVISGRLAQIDPGNSDSYQQGLARFEKKWNPAIAGWEKLATPLRGKDVVYHHKSWAYLNDWLGLIEVATLESKPGVPPSGAHLSELLVQLEARPVAIIIRTPYQNARPSEWLSKRTGTRAIVLPFTVGGTDDAGDLYSLFDTTIRLLIENMGVPR